MTIDSYYKNKLTHVIFGLALVLSQVVTAQIKTFWDINTTNEINFDASISDNLPYKDNIEMAGRNVAGVIFYEVDKEKNLTISREIFYPQLRTFIKTSDLSWRNYRTYYKRIYNDDLLPQIVIGDKNYAPGPLQRIAINGMLEFYHEAVKGIALKRSFFPSMSQRLFVEQWQLTNVSEEEVVLYGNNTEIIQNIKGAKGYYQTVLSSDLAKVIKIAPSESYTFSVSMSATMNDESPVEVNSSDISKERADFLNTVKSNLVLETPSEVLNTLFEFSKIRASESIFDSKIGLIHSPGGRRYYIGFWANDQAEYVNPFFPYLGYKTANDAALNMFMLYKNEIKEDFSNIRYSFEIEGDAKINPLDRGDAAMIAYGASQYALARGDREIAKKIWPLIEWCLEYNRRQLNDEGVVASESDEMEGRIETGNANLSTSSLYYGALNLAYDLGKSIGEPKNKWAGYKKQSEALAKSIENYFGANILGLDTYKYYKEHKYLRHWICLPLVVGIENRKDDTIKALFEQLWSENGLHVENNKENEEISKIFWDRATLYALRGTFLAGETEKSLEKLEQFSEKRLIGNRVPYVVEAYPEGDMAHLSAESGLYCRVFTEGMFGIVPTGLKSFRLTPRLPEKWQHMALKNIRAFDEDFNIEVERVGKKLKIHVFNKEGKTIYSNKIQSGNTVEIKF